MQDSDSPLETANADLIRRFIVTLGHKAAIDTCRSTSSASCWPASGSTTVGRRVPMSGQQEAELVELKMPLA